MKKPALVIVAILVLGVLFGWAATSFRAQRAEDLSTLAREQSALFAPAESMSMGPQDAPVTVVEWFDPGCETCRSFHPFVKQLLAERDGEIRLVLRYAPFHRGADRVSMILEASRRQNMYEETLDLLFQTQQLWADHDDPQPELVWGLLDSTGLDMAKLRTDAGDPVIRRLVERDRADAKRLGVRQTPTFFVNGKPLPSFSREQLEKLVDDEASR